MDKMESEEKELSIYMKQIQYLDKELERCQQECYDLGKEVKDLNSRCRLMEADERDIAEYLEYSSAGDETNTTVNRLTEWLESKRRAIEQDRDALKLQHSQEIQGLQARVDKLNLVSMMHAATSEEQEGQPTQQHGCLESLKEQMAEKKAVFDRLTTESQRRAQNLHKEEDDAIQRMTSNLVQEKRAKYIEQREQFHHLLHESYDLLDLRNRLQKQLQDTSYEVDKMMAFNKNRGERLTREREKNLRRCQQLLEMTENCRTTQKQKLANEVDLRRDLASQSEERRQNTAKTRQLEVDQRGERSKRRELEGVMWEAVTTVRTIVTGPEKASDIHSKKQRLKEALEILKPSLTSAVTPDLPTDPLFLLSRYRVGDLEFVPRPRWKCKPAISTKTKLLPASVKTSSSAEPSPPDPQRTDAKAGASTSADC